MTAPSTDLDRFETALLGRLRDVVAEHADRPVVRPAPAAVPACAPRRWPLPRSRP